MYLSKRFIRLPFLAGVLSFCALAHGQQMLQTVKLVPGWNAVHLKVSPGESADEIFRNWPVESVGVYDAASFARTKQFDSTSSTEGLPSPSVLMWHRLLPGDSAVSHLAANAVLLCYATNSFSAQIYGTPAALRYSWHPTGAGSVYNYIGVSIKPASSTTLAKYFSGINLVNTKASMLYGQNPAQAAFGPFLMTLPVADGMTFAMTAETIGDWSGALHVSPLDGVAFGSEGTLQQLNIRNDAATARTASLSYLFGEAPAPLDIPARCGVLFRDVSGTAPDTEWQDLPAQMQKRLEPGETWKLSLALDRTQFAAVAAGTRYGGLLRVEDVDGGSNFRTTVPLSAISDGGAAGARAWPCGLWVADVQLDKVTQVLNETKLIQGIPSGGNVKLRLPIHVDLNGRLKMIQRVAVAGAQAGDGTIVTSLYAGDAPIPAGANQAMRISAVCLPVDHPIINGVGTFGDDAEFAFVVGANSAANPLRHALHPNHDGLRADFKTPAPSGDDLNNYVSTVKPELFSISNIVSIVWDGLPAGAAAWNPEETLNGKITWEFHGLRREGSLNAQGRFTMRRVATNPDLIEQ